MNAPLTIRSIANYGFHSISASKNGILAITVIRRKIHEYVSAQTVAKPSSSQFNAH